MAVELCWEEKFVESDVVVLMGSDVCVVDPKGELPAMNHDNFQEVGVAA